MAYDFYFPEEYYRCMDCDAQYEDDDEIKEDWKCTKCRGEIIVYTNSKSKDRPYVIIRRFAENVSKQDLVILPTHRDSYSVINNRFENGKHHIALKGHGVIKADDDDWFNCIWGRWSGKQEDLD
ncbi:hypothetical protein [Priestia aryabhattai]